MYDLYVVNPSFNLLEYKDISFKKDLNKMNLL